MVKQTVPQARPKAGHPGTILAGFRARESDFLTLLQELVSRPSRTGEVKEINRFADGLVARFAPLGPSIRRVPTPAGDILDFSFPGQKESGVVLLAHMDTVPSADHPPTGRREGRRFFGNGCYDMKSGIVLFHFLLQSLSKGGGSPSRRVRMICTPDEESGSLASRAYLLESCRRARAVVLPEPSGPRGEVKTRRKGVVWIEARLSGRAAHSGIEPERGRDANRALALLVGRIDRKLREIGDLSFNPGVLSGGRRSNVVSPGSRLEGELRGFSNRDLMRAMNTLPSLSRIGDVRVDWSIRRTHPALEPGKENRRLFALARRIAARLGQSLGQVDSGGASDGSSLSAAGIPVIDGLGMRGGGAHSDEEFIEIDDFPFRAALLTGLVQEI